MFMFLRYCVRKYIALLRKLNLCNMCHKSSPFFQVCVMFVWCHAQLYREERRS
jgi:hypothetical protein